MQKNNINLTALIGKYLKYLNFNKSASKLTLKAYKYDLEQFFVHKKRPSSPKKEEYPLLDHPSQLTLFIQSKIRKGFKSWNMWSIATRNRKISAVKSFLKWLYQEGRLLEDLNKKIKSPKTPFKLPHFLSLDEVMSLIQTLSQAKDPKAPRDLALILLLYGGGLRVSEACSARWSQLNISQKTLKIMGKGQQERLITLPNKVIIHLKTLNRCGLFIFGEKPLNQRKAYSIVRSWGVRAGIHKPISPHVLRHSCATHLLESGLDLRIIQDLLGHRSLSATQKYTQVGLAQLTNTLTHCHPVSHSKKTTK